MSAPPSILLSFRGRNLRSFRDEFELSLEATSYSDEKAVRHAEWRSGGRPRGVLPVAGIYGSNASGKTNVLRSIANMRDLVLTSFRSASPGRAIDLDPFALDEEAHARPMQCIIRLILEGVLHEYGFTVTRERVLEEWANYFPRGRSATIFHRDEERLDFGSSIRGERGGQFPYLSPNVLLLSVAGATSFAPLQPLFHWFQRNLTLSEFLVRTMGGSEGASRALDSPNTQRQLLAMLRAADLGIVNARRRPMGENEKKLFLETLELMSRVSDTPIDVPTPETFGVSLLHEGKDKPREFPEVDESRGTIAWMTLATAIIDSLNAGSVLLVDELDSSLHPALVAEAIRLYQDAESNPLRAQLIFCAHDLTLMSDTEAPLLGRDQIWFTEKHRDGHTVLFSLADLKPRRREAVFRRYLQGRYGASPIISHSDFISAVARAGAENGSR